MSQPGIIQQRKPIILLDLNYTLVANNSARCTRIKNLAGAIKTVEVPWDKPNGGFTLLMELV